ncbi:MAG TPA: DNA-binding domain-containing protein [Polyangiaceae bacterium]|nr:DNA-binding domain-containing protein [Polyangiaceae bacterium]
MSELTRIQEQMAAFLRHGRALEKSSEARSFAELEIGGSARLSPVEQLEIYREQFWLRHTSALLEDFPGLSGILGQQSWERLAEAYFAEFAPVSYSLRDLGKDLPAFVARATFLEHRDLCSDMARLEWAYVEAFDAADVAPLEPARLAAIPDEAWESARLVLGPSLGLLRLRYPVASLRARLVQHPDESVAIPEPASTLLAVCRQGLQVRTHELTEPAFVLLEQLREGLPLVPAVESAARILSLSAEALAPELGAWFASWAQHGIVVQVLV